MASVITTTFECPGADGGPLRGEVRTAQGGADRPAVVLCHGFKGFKDWGFFPHLAGRIARAGLTSVSFNFSGSGIGPDGGTFSEPARFGHATFTNDLIDIGLVCDRVREGTLVDGLAAPTRLGLFGHSRGGGMALAYAAASPSVRALVTWSAIGTVRRWPPATMAAWRRDGAMNIVNSRTGETLPLYTDLLDDIERHETEKLDLCGAASRLAVPWLLLHGTDDETVPLQEGCSLRDAADRATAVFREVPNVSHTMGARHPWSGSTAELTLAMGETVAWFASHLF